MKTNDLKINVELEGYEDIKAQLNDIEAQLDRILEKQGQLIIDEVLNGVKEI